MKRSEKIIKYIEVLAVILTSGSCLYNAIYWIVGAAVAGLLLSKRILKNNLNRLFGVLVFILANTFLNYSYGTDWSGMLVLVLRLAALAIIYSSLTIREYSNIFVNIISFMAMYCLFFFFIVYVFGQSVLPFTFYVSQYKTYATPYFVIGGLGVKRNYGIFWEPGVYQIYLNLALCMVLFNSGQSIKNKNCKILVLAASVISTFSSTGYLVLAGILAVYTFSNKEAVMGKLSLLKKIAVVIIFIVGIFFEVSTATVSGKFTVANSSYRSRYDDLLIAITATIENNMLLGNGVESNLAGLYRKYTNLAGRYTYGTANIANSNGLGTFALRCGVIATLIFLAMNYKRLKELLRLEGWPLLGIFITWVLCLASEPLHFTPLMLGCFFEFYDNYDDKVEIK